MILTKSLAELQKVKGSLSTLQDKLGQDIDIYVTDITDHTIRSLEHEVQTLENLIKALINRAEQELSLQDVTGTLGQVFGEKVFSLLV